MHKWIKQLGKQPNGSQVTASEHEELVCLCREDRILRESVRDTKKSSSVFCERAVVKYAFIAAHKEWFRIRVMCRVLGASSSGYHEWLTRKCSIREKKDTHLAKRPKIKRRSVGTTGSKHDMPVAEDLLN
jgi:hypothetical protein